MTKVTVKVSYIVDGRVVTADGIDMEFDGAIDRDALINVMPLISPEKNMPDFAALPDDLTGFPLAG